MILLIASQVLASEGAATLPVGVQKASLLQVVQTAGERGIPTWAFVNVAPEVVDVRVEISVPVRLPDRLHQWDWEIGWTPSPTNRSNTLLVDSLPSPTTMSIFGADLPQVVRLYYYVKVVTTYSPEAVLLSKGEILVSIDSAGAVTSTSCDLLPATEYASATYGDRLLPNGAIVVDCRIPQ